MTEINVWLKDLLPRTPGLLRQVAARETRLAAREFFQRSRCWREITAPATVIADQADYVPVPSDPVNAEVFDVNAVTFLGQYLRPVITRPIGPMPDMTPHLWFAMEPGQCTLWPTPTLETPAALEFHVELIPTMSSLVLPDFTYQRYYDAILDGALSRIFMHPSKAYSDLARAAYHRSRFRAAIGEAAGSVKTGHNDSLSWRFPSFA